MKQRKKRSPRGRGVGSRKQHARAAPHHTTSRAACSQVFPDASSIAEHMHNSRRLAVVFTLDHRGRLCDNVVILHGSEPLGVVPVPMLSQIADRLPELDTADLRGTIATWQAEQAGMGGRA